jgi:hypothetical protein
VVSFTALPLYPLGKNPQYTLNRRLGGPQSLSGLGEEKILAPTGARTQTFGRQARSQSLYRLRYTGHYLHKITETQEKRGQISMPQVGFEPKIPVSERENTYHVLDHMTTVIGLCFI